MSRAACLMVQGTSSGVGKSLLAAALLDWLAARAGCAGRPEWGEMGSRRDRWDRLADVVGGALDVKAIGRLVGVAL